MRIIVFTLLLGMLLIGCAEDENITSRTETTPTAIDENNQSIVITWQKDGATMVLIPAGSFEMGDHFEEGEDDELPVHKVDLDAFYMDRYEVTIEQYKQFLSETNYGTLPEQTPNWIEEKVEIQDDKKTPQTIDFTTPTDNHPITGITFIDAQAYAQWAGKRLPTEAEWEYAARGGLVGKRYVWGNQPPDARYCNFTQFFDKELAEDGFLYTAPVGNYDANGFILFDIAGNVWEWCSDWYDENYYANSVLKNPDGPADGTERVIRGGGWSSHFHNLRVARRSKLAPNATGFTYQTEFTGLEKPDLEQRQKPLDMQKPNQDQNPPDNPDFNQSDMTKQQMADKTVWVGFRCVADLTTVE